LSKNNYCFNRKKRDSDNRKRNIGKECKKSWFDRRMKRKKSKTGYERNFGNNKRQTKKKAKTLLLKVVRLHLMIPSLTMHQPIINLQLFRKHLCRLSRKSCLPLSLKSWQVHGRSLKRLETCLWNRYHLE
jgi:hypothetical protein